MDMEVHPACGEIDFVDIKVNIVYMYVRTEEFIMVVKVIESTAPRREAHFKSPMVVLGSSFQ